MIPIPSATAEDDALLSAARGGDRAAIERLLSLHQPDIRRFARRVCRTSEDADDAVQHAMAQLSTQLGGFRGLSRLTTWLFTIVKHECSRIVSRTRRLLLVDVDTLERVVCARRDVELAVALDQAFARLDPELRQVVLLRDVQQLTGPEVAAELGLTLEGMKSRLHRAREQLRRELSSAVGLESEPAASPRPPSRAR